MRKIFVVSFYAAVFTFICALLGLSYSYRLMGIGTGQHAKEINRHYASVQNETQHIETIRPDYDDSTERILACYSRIEQSDLYDTWDRLMDLVSNADKLKAYLIAARIGKDRLALIEEIISERVEPEDVGAVCRILEECLTEKEMKQLADMAEKYIRLLGF